jgi:hypothetical protein
MKGGMNHMSRQRRERRRQNQREGNQRLTAPEQHKEFIAQNWDHLAAAAWRGYQEVGRGFLDINVDKVQGDPPNDRFPPFCTYAADKHMKEQGLAYPTNELQRLVQIYDPEQSVVFLFHWEKADGPGERFSTYRVMAQPFPKDTVWLGDVGQIKVKA